jgi:general stress protein YciG
MTSTKQRKGFAVLPLEERRRIARLGGQAVRPENRAYSKNRELAVEAGRKGGLAARRKK